MALTLNTLPTLAFAYTDKLQIVATEDTMTSAGRYIFQVTVANPFDQPYITFHVKPDPNLNGVLDLSPIITELLESGIYINSGSVHNLPDLLAAVQVTIISQATASAVTTSTITTERITLINGVDSRNKEIILNNRQYFEGGIDGYLWTSGVGQFLTKQKGERKVTMASKIFLQVLNGTYAGGVISDYNGIRVQAYNSAGSAGYYDYPNTSSGILSIDVSPASHSVITPDVIRYEIQPHGGGQAIQSYSIDRSTKIKTKYCFLYVNSLGATDSIDFTRVAEENMSITKDALTQGYSRKQVNTEARETIEVYSDWMSEEVSHGIKDFWISPKVQLRDSFFNEYHEVILKNTAVTIQKRHNSKLIQYRVSFEYAEIFKTQRQ